MQKIAINFTYLNELLLPLSKKKKTKLNQRVNFNLIKLGTQHASRNEMNNLERQS